MAFGQSLLHTRILDCLLSGQADVNAGKLIADQRSSLTSEGELLTLWLTGQRSVVASCSVWSAGAVSCLLRAITRWLTDISDPLMQQHLVMVGGESFLAYEDFEEGLTNQSSPKLNYYYFLMWRSAGAHLFHSLGQDQSTVAQRAWDDCGRVFPDEMRVSSFPWQVPTLCLDSIVSPHRNRYFDNFYFAVILPNLFRMEASLSHFILFYFLQRVINRLPSDTLFLVMVISYLTSSGDCQETETGIARACHAPRQTLQNHPSGYLGGWATPWSAEEMLDGQRQRMDVPAHARSALNSLAPTEKTWRGFLLNWTTTKDRSGQITHH